MLFVITLVLFSAFLILLITGIIKQNRKLIYSSLIALGLSIVCGICVGVIVAKTVYTAVKTGENPLKRSGMEIYTALFDDPETSCVKVLNSQDQYVPRVDCCIWLEFTTCPNELNRIITANKLKPNEEDIPDHDSPDWFRKQNLDGYAIRRKFSYSDPNHDVILWFSKDSTHAFYCDMAE